mgnify:CR=1 FL=1
MKNPYTLYEQEVLSALYKSLNYCEENDLPTNEISQVLNGIEAKTIHKEVM